MFNHCCYLDKCIFLLYLSVSPALRGKHILPHGKGRRGFMLQLPWYSTWSFCKPCLGTSASHISQLVIAPFQQTFFLMSLCDSAKPGSTHRVKQPVPCLIYSCHPLIYKFHDAIKIKTLSFVLQYLLFTCPTLCCSGNSPPTCSSPSTCVACGLWSRYCLGN